MRIRNGALVLISTLATRAACGGINPCEQYEDAYELKLQDCGGYEPPGDDDAQLECPEESEEVYRCYGRCLEGFHCGIVDGSDVAGTLKYQACMEACKP